MHESYRFSAARAKFSAVGKDAERGSAHRVSGALRCVPLNLFLI